jgi:hypothetical protein
MNWYKKSFLKVSERIQMEDGTWWEEVNGDIVEVRNPTDPKDLLEPKSYNVDLYDIVFTEGEKYENYYGTFEVLSINDDGTMGVKYIDVCHDPVQLDKVYTYKMVDQAKSMHKINLGKDRENRMKSLEFSGSDEHFTLGYLASKGLITIEVPISQVQTFAKKFESLTGEDIDQYKGHGYFVIENENNRWAPKCRIIFAADPVVVSRFKFPNGVEVMSDSKGDFVINNNNFVFNLLKMGFSIGNNKRNIIKILNSIPNHLKENFIEGVDI